LNKLGISSKFENLALGDSDYGSDEEYSDDFEDEDDDYPV